MKVKSIGQDPLRQLQDRPAPRRRDVHLHQPEAQAAPGVADDGTIAGIDIPREKRVEIALT